MDQFNASMIAKSEKVLEQDGELKQKILEECANISKDETPDVRAQKIMQVLFELKQIRPEYLASESELSNAVFLDENTFKAFLANLKEYKEMEKGLFFSNEEIDKEIFDLDNKVMPLNPSKLEEAQTKYASVFSIGEETDLDKKMQQDLSSDNIMPETTVSEEDVNNAPSMRELKEESLDDLADEALENYLSEENDLEVDSPEVENKLKNKIKFTDLSTAALGKILKKKSNVRDDEEHKLQSIRDVERERDLEMSQEFLTQCYYDKKTKAFRNRETGAIEVKVDATHFLSGFMKKDKHFNHVARATTGPKPSTESMKALLYMVEPKVIRGFPSGGNKKNAEENFKQALIEMQEEGFDLNKIKVSAMMNYKNANLRKILEEVKQEQFTVGLTNDELKANKRNPTYNEKQDEADIARMEAKKANDPNNQPVAFPEGKKPKNEGEGSEKPTEQEATQEPETTQAPQTNEEPTQETVQQENTNSGQSPTQPEPEMNYNDIPHHSQQDMDDYNYMQDYGNMPDMPDMPDQDFSDERFSPDEMDSAFHNTSGLDSNAVKAGVVNRMPEKMKNVVDMEAFNKLPSEDIENLYNSLIDIEEDSSGIHRKNRSDESSIFNGLDIEEHKEVALQMFLLSKKMLPKDYVTSFMERTNGGQKSVMDNATEELGEELTEEIKNTSPEQRSEQKARTKKPKPSRS